MNQTLVQLGGPFNYVTANYLHGADIAYYVGGIVAAVVYWLWRTRRRAGPPCPEPGSLRGSSAVGQRRRLVDHGRQIQRLDVDRDLGAGRDPQPVDRARVGDQALERGSP